MPAQTWHGHGCARALKQGGGGLGEVPLHGGVAPQKAVQVVGQQRQQPLQHPGQGLGCGLVLAPRPEGLGQKLREIKILKPQQNFLKMNFSKIEIFPNSFPHFFPENFVSRNFLSALYVKPPPVQSHTETLGGTSGETGSCWGTAPLPGWTWSAPVALQADRGSAQPSSAQLHASKLAKYTAPSEAMT